MEYLDGAGKLANYQSRGRPEWGWREVRRVGAGESSSEKGDVFCVPDMFLSMAATGNQHGELLGLCLYVGEERAYVCWPFFRIGC